MSDIQLKETLIFNQLIHNSEFFYKVFPFLQDDYFDGPEKVLYRTIKMHFDKFDSKPSTDILEVYLSDNKHINEKLFSATLEYVKLNLVENKKTDYDWLVKTTEEFCQNKGLYNALAKAVTIYDNPENDDIPVTAIPDILNEALGISFNTDIGLDYIEDAEERFDRLHMKFDKLPFLCPIFNDITKGGFERKTLNLILASTNVGKSAWMCHYAAEMASQGCNVLYVSMEMAEEKISTRIDANLMDKTMDQLTNMDKKTFLSNVDRLKKKGIGRMIIKEFPTASVHMGHVEAMLRELKLKMNFEPDIVCLDYLNICLSKRVSLNKGSYMFVKAIAEEFRGLAVKYNFIGVSATQGSRSTIESSDIGMQDTGESKGINDTADFILGMMAPEEVAKQGLMLCKQLKSRYDDVNRRKKFALSFDRNKMYFEEASNPDAVADFLGNKKEEKEDDKPMFDKSTGDRFLSQGDLTKKLLGSSAIKF